MTPTFGAGGGEPYARALQNDGLLLLVPDDGGSTDSLIMDVSRWSATADATDMSLIEEGSGPLLDIGCGPGRMVAAALTAGYSALGVDVSQAAVDLARRSGIPALRASVFDPLPREGEWMTVLLVDGNIGIGGDPTALLERCAELLSPHGSALIELQNDPAADRSYGCTIVGDEGYVSDSFPWSEIGSDALARRATGTALVMTESWCRDGRSFARLVKRG
ncbi:class I SAM-dependent methyltransferase [Subtercola lobariae]|uniref:Methyltransferase type 11 n=1 Tax=Subtercola lobariae TaxID=1588641 RepID=A0A917B1R1_9MICO|nr:class I SAM-dependent methyltransferase [Subtercola lobariae]GGF17266.1 methyltransferase type 11 [Subtercola lobariae]